MRLSGGRKHWARWLYSALLYLLSPLIWWRVWREWLPTHPRRERLGWLPVSPAGQRVIWLHAASVGEVVAARPLIASLRHHYPRHRIALTTMTATGAERVLTLYKGEVSHYFVPLDFPGVAQRFIARLRPELALFFETELWPNLLYACHRQKVPVAVVNGRLSAKAMQGYRRISALMNDALANIDWLAAKSSSDAERFQALGMAANRTTVVGSLKFDMTLDDTLDAERERLRSAWGERPVWIAGSTHPGEDEQVLAAHAELRQRHPDALLILVPRHPRRFEEVATLCRGHGAALARRSRGDRVDATTSVYLGDSMGELTLLYGAADIAFVGGSLVPIGGHNLLEPAALGVPVLSGPQLANFSDVAEVLGEAQALVVVKDEAALAQALADLLEDPARCKRMAEAGRGVIEANRGALLRTLTGLETLLPFADSRV